MEQWRLIDIQAADAYTNMATDEAIMQGIIDGHSKNTVRFYTWNPSAVSIGYFQGIREEVNLEECEKLGIDVVRRRTGGGAVFHDSKGEFTYSLVISENHEIAQGDYIKSFENLSKGIIMGLNKLGVKAVFSPINDLTVNGKKISGNAQTRRSGVILQHGTILIRTSPEMIFRVLKVSNEKMSDKMLLNFLDRVTNIEKEIKGYIKETELRDAIKKGFEEALGLNFINESLNEYEILKLNELKEKYSSKNWNYQR
jgi:lipoate-protein ligase A